MLIAFAISIALHEILAGLLPALFAVQPQRERIGRVEVAQVSVRAIPTPTPTPPPRPPPRRISHARAIAPTERRTVARTHTGRSAPKSRIRRAAAARPKPPVLHLRPVWDLPIPVGGRGAGAGNRTGAGSLGTGQSGSGAGASGSGSGAAAGNEPCGFVEFSDPHGSRYDPRTHGFWVDIRMSVRFPDGRTQSTVLDYPWYYPNEAANPWSNQNLNDPNFPTRFQAPPPDKAASEPPLVAYVIAHSTANGFTLLKDCPSEASPQPSPTSSP